MNKCLPYKTSQKFKCNLNKKVMTEIYSGALTCMYTNAMAQNAFCRY